MNKISPKIVNETLNMKIGDEFDQNKLNNAIKRFYKFGYFDDIVLFNEDGNLKLTFKEKPSIANVEIKGYKNRVEDLEKLKFDPPIGISHLKPGHEAGIVWEIAEAFPGHNVLRLVNGDEFEL